MTPPAKVAAAMPGTLDEIVERTGYPVAEVLKQIGNLRREGRIVVVVPDSPGWGPSTGPSVYTLGGKR